MEVSTTWCKDTLCLTVTIGDVGTTLDIPTLLHDAGLLHRIARDGSVPLRVSPFSGKYVGVAAGEEGYTALSGKRLVASRSARGAAIKRARLLRNVFSRPSDLFPADVSTDVPPAEVPECEYVGTRTREERDEEGRRAAIALD